MKKEAFEIIENKIKKRSDNMLIKEAFENLKENLEKMGYDETEKNSIAELVDYDYEVADQYQECVSGNEFDMDLFQKNYEIYTDKDKFIADWFDGEALNNEELINKIETYGAGLSVSYNEDMSVFIVDKR